MRPLSFRRNVDSDNVVPSEIGSDRKGAMVATSCALVFQVAPKLRTSSRDLRRLPDQAVMSAATGCCRAGDVRAEALSLVWARYMIQGRPQGSHFGAPVPQRRGHGVGAAMHCKPPIRNCNSGAVTIWMCRSAEPAATFPAHAPLSRSCRLSG